MHESYRNSLPLDDVGVEDRPGLENDGSSRSPYDISIDGDFQLFQFMLPFNWISY